MYSLTLRIKIFLQNKLKVKIKLKEDSSLVK